MDHPVKPPLLLVVKRVYYDQFEAGTKAVERRLHRPPFTARAFHVGRLVRIAYNFNVKRFPSLLAEVISFDVGLARAHPEMIELYPPLLPSDEIALITLAIQR